MRIVAKIGTSSLTDQMGRVDRAAVASLCAQVAELRLRGDEVVVVTSGAVAAGVAAMGFATRPSDMETLQALSAVGQSRLMAVYDAELSHHGLIGAQVLLDPHDFIDRRQYLHSRRTIDRLLELGCIPLINENDAIANTELRYGDNDRMAALLAHNVSADVCVLLTDLDGLYTTDPRSDPEATLVELVTADDPLLAISASSSGSGRGSGGMASKLAAARIASWSGIRTVIARASRGRVLVDASDGRPVGTTFEAHDRHLGSRKLWIAFAAETTGRISVDEGARSALTARHSSLLPAGIVGVDGQFEEGDTVEVVGPGGEVFARGMVFIASRDLAGVIGRRTSDLPDGMVHEVIHRDDLVLLPG